MQVENSALKDQLAILEQDPFSSATVHPNVLNIPIEKVFESITMQEASNRQRALTILKRANITRLSDVNGIFLCDILHIRNAGTISCALILVVFEHYGIDLKVPNTSEDSARQLRAFNLKYKSLKHTRPLHSPMTLGQYEKKVSSVIEKASEFRRKLDFVDFSTK